MLTLKELSRKNCEGVSYTLFSLKFEECVRFALCVCSHGESAMEVVGGTECQARELFTRVSDGALSPEHLEDVAEDYRHAEELL